MSLRLKIISGFLILAVMLITAGALSIYELKNIGHSVQALLDDNYKSINAAKNMIEALERADSGVLLLLSGEWEKGRTTIEEANKDFQEAFGVAKNNITIPGELEYVESVMKFYEIYRSYWNQPLAGTKKQGDLSWYFNEVHTAFNDAKTHVNNLMTLNDKTMYKTASSLKGRAGRAIMPGVVAIISALVFTAVFNFLINLYFISPIKNLITGIYDYMKTGKQSALRVYSRDEIGKLSSAIEELITYHQKGKLG